MSGGGTEQQLLRGFSVARAIPGRVRLRAETRRARQDVQAAAEALSALPEISEAQARQQSGSVVLRCELEVELAPLLDSLVQRGVQRQGETGAGAQGDPAAWRLRRAARALNGVAARATGGTDLRLLVPLGLGLLSLRRLATGEQRLSDAPWYLPAWYAFELFHRLDAGKPVRAPRVHEQ